MNEKTGVVEIDSAGLLDCPNCHDGMELKHDGENFYEAKCSMCNGTTMLDQKQSDGLRKLRAVYQKTRQSNKELRKMTEFKKGDTVTFKSYHDPIKAEVIDVAENGFTAKTTLPEYRLEGIDKPLVSITTGKSIVESRYFDEYKGERWTL